MESLGESKIASISQSCLDKLLTYSQVFKSIEEITIGNLDLQFLNGNFLFSIEIESHVVKPCEISNRLNFICYKSSGDVSLMDKIGD
jgi:hypothetical protein